MKPPRKQFWPDKNLENILSIAPKIFAFDTALGHIFSQSKKYDSLELGEELCPVSSSLLLRVYKVYIIFGHFFKMAAALCYK